MIATTPIRSVVMVSGDHRPRLDGVADYTERLAEALRARDVDVTVFTAAAPDPGELRAGAVDATGPLGWTAAGTRRAAVALRAAAPDVVHVQFAPSAFGWHGQIGLLPALIGPGGPPLVTTLHEYAWWAWPPLLAPIERALRPIRTLAERAGAVDRESVLLVPRSRALVVTNGAHRAALAARFPDAAPRTAEIPIGPNVRAARTAAVPATPAGGATVAFFGFVHPVKGVEVLLEAVARQRRERPGLRLVVVGGFESLALAAGEAAAYRGRVEALADDLGLAGAVALTGFVDEAEVTRHLAGADVAVAPFHAGATRKSGSLLALLAHGLPVVATAADPPDRALAAAALTVSPRDPVALAAAIGAVLDDPALAARLGAAGRALADAEHGWPAIADRHLAVYERVLAARRAAA